MPTQSRKSTATPKQKKPRSTKLSPAGPPGPPPPQTSGAPDENRYVPTAWGGAGQDGFGGAHDLEMPSGQLALVRRPGLQQLIVEGVLHHMDNLTALVDKKYIRKGPKNDEIDVKGLLGDTDTLANILHNVDRVVCAVVIRPQVEMAPNDITNRKMGVIYADTIAIEDKMFLFNWALGGSRDIERFRRESRAVVGGLDIEPNLEGSAE